MVFLRRFSLVLISAFLIFSFSTFSQQSLVWANPFGSGGSGDEGESVAVDVNGNVYVAGVFEGTVDFDPGPGISKLSSLGTTDIFVMKLSAEGTLIWAKNFGSATTTDRPTSIAVDANGNVYTTGLFWSTVDFDPGSGVANLSSFGDFDVFVTKFDTEGNYVWAKNMGGTERDAGNSIVVDNLGNVYTTGAFAGTADFDPSLASHLIVSKSQWTDIFICKLGPSGNFLWAKGIGGAWYDFGRGIALDASGNVIVTGDFYDDEVDFDPGAGELMLNSTGRNSDIFVSKFDATGNFIWAKQMGGNDYDNGYSVTLDNSGNIYTTGYFSGVADFNPAPEVFNLELGNIFVSKLTAGGDFFWAKEMEGRGGGFNGNIGTSIKINSNGHVFTVGSFAGRVDFDPGPGVYGLVSEGIDDVFISELDGSGNFVCAGRIGGPMVDKANSIAVNGANIYCAGFFEGVADFDPGNDTVNLGLLSRDAFVAKYASCLSVGQTEEEAMHQSAVSVYPNPNNGSFALIFNSISNKTRGEVRVINDLGQEVYKQKIKNNSDPFKEFIELENTLPNGIYLVQIIGEVQVSESKIVLIK